MWNWVFRVLRICREMRVLSAQALDAFEQANDGAVDIVKGQMRRLVIDLAADLPADFPPCRIGDLRRHIGFSMDGDYRDILRFDLPDIEEKIEGYATRGVVAEIPAGFDDLLHPPVRDAAIRHYHAGDFRNAVLDA